MPWRTKRIVYLMLLGAVLVGCAVAVIIRNRSIDSHLLAVAALAGGLAVFIVALPDDGG